MTKYNKVYVNGFWNHSGDNFFNMCVTEDTWDCVEDAEDQTIFYYTDGEPILGNHGDFTITEIVGEIKQENYYTKLTQAINILNDIYHEVCYWDQDYFEELEGKINTALAEARLAMEIIDDFKNEGVL